MDSQNITEEIWKPVTGWEDRYEVSSLGRVRSLYARTGRRQVPKILMQEVGPQGRHRVRLSRNYVSRKYVVPRLMLTALVRPPKDGEFACHFDDDPWNNTLWNLRWATQRENMQDRMRNKGYARGEEHCRSRLTTEAVLEIRRLKEEGIASSSIARRFGIGRATVYNVCQRLTWRHV